METSLQEVALFPGSDHAVGLDAETTRGAGDLTVKVWVCGVGVGVPAADGPSEGVVRDPYATDTRGRFQAGAMEARKREGSEGME